MTTDEREPEAGLSSITDASEAEAREAYERESEALRLLSKALGTRREDPYVMRHLLAYRDAVRASVATPQRAESWDHDWATCARCGHEYSTAAEACVECGATPRQDTLRAAARKAYDAAEALRQGMASPMWDVGSGELEQAIFEDFARTNAALGAALAEPVAQEEGPRCSACGVLIAEHPLVDVCEPEEPVAQQEPTEGVAADFQRWAAIDPDEELERLRRQVAGYETALRFIAANTDGLRKGLPVGAGETAVREVRTVLDALQS